MRRAQTTRHHARPSAAHSHGNSSGMDDLGMLREVVQEESVEVTLRKQLLEKERENDRLQAQIESLQSQLADRPPIEAIQGVQKERQNLELLLVGTQRENEKSMAALEMSKAREKQLEKKLTELLGENWQNTLEMGPAPSITMSTRGFHSHSRSMSSPMSPSPRSGTPLNGSFILDTSTAHAPANSSSIGGGKPATPVTLEQIEQVRLLVLGMEQRLQNREQKLMKIVEKAEGEGKRFEEGRKSVLAMGQRRS